MLLYAMSDALVNWAIKGVISPLLLWRGWETNETEGERLRGFLAYGHGLCDDVDQLSVGEFKDLRFDLSNISRSFNELQSTPALLQVTGHKQIASELATLKGRTEEAMRMFEQKLAVDTNKKITLLERYQRKVFSE